MLLKWALAALRNADPLAVYQHDLAWITPAQTQRHTHTPRLARQSRAVARGVGDWTDIREHLSLRKLARSWKSFLVVNEDT